MDRSCESCRIEAGSDNCKKEQQEAMLKGRFGKECWQPKKGCHNCAGAPKTINCLPCDEPLSPTGWEVKESPPTYGNPISLLSHVASFNQVQGGPGGLCSECSNEFCKIDEPPGQMGSKQCWKPIKPLIKDTGPHSTIAELTDRAKRKFEMEKKPTGTGWYVVGYMNPKSGGWKVSNTTYPGTLAHIQQYLANSPTQVRSKPCQLMTDHTLQPMEEEKPESTPGPWKMILLESTGRYRIEYSNEDFIGSVDTKEDAETIINAPQTKKDLEEAAGLLARVDGICVTKMYPNLQHGIKDFLQRFDK